MTKINNMQLLIPALSKNEAFARSTVAVFCLELSGELEFLSDIKTAVSEAVTNSIVHGYTGNKEGIISLTAVIELDQVTITITDNGEGIQDIEQARKPFFTTKPEQERSGMGFTLMETFMDSLNVDSNANGTVITMIKKAPNKSSEVVDA